MSGEMESIHSGEFKRGHLFSDGQEGIYEVRINYHFEKGFKYDEDGKITPYRPIDVNVLIFNSADDVKSTGVKEVQPEYLTPLPIKEVYLKYLGFHLENRDGKDIWVNGKISLPYLKAHGIQMAVYADREAAIPVVSVSDLQYALELR